LLGIILCGPATLWRLVWSGYPMASTMFNLAASVLHMFLEADAPLSYFVLILDQRTAKWKLTPIHHLEPDQSTLAYALGLNNSCYILGQCMSLNYVYVKGADR